MTKQTKDERPRSRMDWDDIRIFAAVADAGSVNKAAQTLKVSPAMVSRRLDDLEQRLGVKLFTRTPTGVMLTAAGEDIRDNALSMQRFADAIEGTARGRDHREEGVVRLAVPDGLAAYWLAPKLGQFFQQCPNIQVSLGCGFGAHERDLLPDMTITADKTCAGLEDVARPLATLHYVFAASRDYVSIYGTPSTPVVAATDHRALRHVAQTYQRDQWSNRAIAVEALSTFSLETNSSAVLTSALLNGAGVATIPSFGFHLFPDLVLIGGEVSTPIQLWLITHQEAQNTVRVQRVARWLRAIFDTKRNPWFRDEYVHPHRFSEELNVTPRRLSQTDPQGDAANRPA